MQKLSIIIAFLHFITFSTACKKDKRPGDDCFTHASTARIITNAAATVVESSGKFYIIEQNTIDTRLNPCTLDKEFQMHNLLVTVSGEVKVTLQGGPNPCCTEDFIITKISK